MEFLSFTTAGLGLLGLIAFVFVYSRGSVARETITLQEQNRRALEDRVKILEDSDQEKTRRIAELEGEVRTLKTIPLSKLAKSYETMAQILRGVGDTQDKMLTIMESLVNR